MNEIIIRPVYEEDKPTKEAVDAFQAFVDRGGFAKCCGKRLARSSRAASVKKWNQIRSEYPSLTYPDIKKVQTIEASERRKRARRMYRELGVLRNGKLAKDSLWRVIQMGDTEASWKKNCHLCLPFK